MDEELANSNISDDEEDTQRLEEDEDYELCSVGRVLTESVVHIPSMRQALAEVWHPVGGISIKNLGEKRTLFRMPIRMRQMEDSKWLREDRSSSKSIVGGQLGDNEERLAGVNPNLSPHQGRRGKDTTRLEGINYGGEDVRYMELRSNTKEIPIGVIDTKKRQRLYSMSSIVSHIVDSKNSPIISTATEKQTDRSQ
ncbi:hypothetical protein Gorai_019279 [Gossypium raimondii]|uniref:DUF4283 domain-containing protein n=1 Tax=Gossypium raimondii TaxID=29730 RepID=A0A7J8PMS5_GOSRA|nr:hypothetical protein [Gossypium raimondii]